MTILPVQALWEKHLSEPFPTELVMEEVDGLNVALLEAAAAGCIAEYLANDGQLDQRRTAMLGITFRHLAIVARRQTGEAQDYFLRLEDIALQVLTAIMDAPTAA
jgi:hypothetical protein